MYDVINSKFVNKQALLGFGFCYEFFLCQDWTQVNDHLLIKLVLNRSSNAISTLKKNNIIFIS